MSKTISDFFKDKPETYEIFKVIQTRIDTCGPNDISVSSQISFGTKRKFAWIWLYNVTQKNPNGLLHLMLNIDRKLDDPHIKNITQISKNRWNHLVIVRTLTEAKSMWLKNLIHLASQLGNK